MTKDTIILQKVVSDIMSPKIEIKNKKDKHGFISIKCYYCNERFGLDSNFVDRYSELNYYYTCPYCGCADKIKE